MTVNKEMYGLGSKRSVIRELFEYGRQRVAEFGADSVCDFSLGNPAVPPPDCVKEAIFKYSAEPNTHAYTSAVGAFATRKAIADDLNQRYGTILSPDHLYMTCGAAASLTITLRALNEGNDDFIAIAPYFPEYGVFVRAAGGNFRVVPPDEQHFQINFAALEGLISQKTKAVIINSPNNPSGAVYTEATLTKLSKLLSERSAQYGKPIYLISDEPYREIVYVLEPPFIMNKYPHTVVCYSYSKSLSLPGERIGYIAVSPETDFDREIYAAICGAGRALGYVCAPSLFQNVIADTAGATADFADYRKNRNLLYDTLSAYGYKCVHPDGAFYLFVKCPGGDANAFCDRAKELGLLIVPGDDFGAPGYCRIAYCVPFATMTRALPLFAKLIEAKHE